MNNTFCQFDNLDCECKKNIKEHSKIKQENLNENAFLIEDNLNFLNKSFKNNDFINLMVFIQSIIFFFLWMSKKILDYKINSNFFNKQSKFIKIKLK